MDFYKNVKKKLCSQYLFLFKWKFIFFFFFFLESTHFALRWHSFVDSQIYLAVEEAE